MTVFTHSDCLSVCLIWREMCFLFQDCFHFVLWWLLYENDLGSLVTGDIRSAWVTNRQMRDRGNTREIMVGQISDDKERDRKEESKSFFHIRIRTERKCLSNQYKRQLKIYVMQSLFIFVYTTQHTVISMFVEHLNMKKMTTTICHCQINENASSCIWFVFNIKSNFYKLGARMRTVIDFGVHLSSAGINQLQQQKVRETRNKVTEKTNSCKIRYVCRFSTCNSARSPCLSL